MGNENYNYEYKCVVARSTITWHIVFHARHFYFITTTSTGISNKSLKNPPSQMFIQKLFPFDVHYRDCLNRLNNEHIPKFTSDNCLANNRIAERLTVKLLVRKMVCFRENVNSPVDEEIS